MHLLSRTVSILLVLIVAAVLPKRVWGYEVVPGYTHTVWTTFDDVHANNGVYAITQDRVGYIWIGFLDGLVRFDGARFVRWQALGRPLLPQRPVTGLAASRDGSLWIGFGNLGGVSRFQDGVLHNYTPQDGVPEGAIREIREDRDGTIWVGGYTGLARFRGGKWERVTVVRGTPEATVYVLFEDAQGFIRVMTQAGAFRGDRNTGLFEYLGPSPERLSSSSNVKEPEWPIEGRETFKSLDPGVQPPGFVHDSSGQLWLGYRHGLFHITPRPGGARVEQFTSQNGLTSDYVNVLFQDRDGNVWIGTNAGLDVLALRKPRPFVVRRELADSRVLAVTVGTHDDMWVGSDNGLYRFSPSGTTVFHRRDGLPSDVVRDLYLDPAGTLWIATDEGVSSFANQHLRRVPLQGAASLSHVVSLTADRDGALWLCDFRALYRLNDGILTEVRDPDIAGRRPSVVYTDSTGAVWVGFWSGGVAVYRGPVRTIYGAQDGLAAGRVTSIYEDRAHAIWVTTLNEVSRFERDRFLTPSETSGLVGHLVLSMTEDAREYLWLGTMSGLFRIHRTELVKATRDPQYRPVFGVFGSAEGLDSNATKLAMARDGALWLGGTGTGMIVIDPTRVQQAQGPPVFIEQLVTDRGVFEPGAAPDLPAHTSRVQIDYTSLSFAHPPGLQFKYRLEGFDPDWVASGTLRRAYYTNLPPRAYRFRVAASYDGSTWNEARLPLAFAILPAFYQTLWAYAALAVTLTLAVWGAWRIRLHRVRRQYALVLAERTRLSREIHDTLLQGMVGVALQIHGLSERLDPSMGALKPTLDRARDYLEHYIREARLSISELRSPSVGEHDLPAAVQEAGQTITAGTPVAFDLVVRGRPTRLEERVIEHLLRIAREAIANAVRHAHPTRIDVELVYDASSVRLRVVDDGHGFDPEDVRRQAAGDRWGLTTMRERAQEIGARFRCASSFVGGTEIEAVAPVVLPH